MFVFIRHIYQGQKIRDENIFCEYMYWLLSHYIDKKIEHRELMNTFIYVAKEAKANE